MSTPIPNPPATFGADTAFLQAHTEVIVLADRNGLAKVAVVPAWQGRVMTSTAGGDAGVSHGWINRELIAGGKIQPHINAYGGEDRFWLGPEGGQFSIFFAPGAKFELADWYTPAGLDTEPFKVTWQSAEAVRCQAEFAVTNYSGTRFAVRVNREVRLLGAEAAAQRLGIADLEGVNVVAFETVNELTNAGPTGWEMATGLLSVWILGMFNPSPTATIVVPFRPGSEAELGPKMTADYFGPMPPERLVVKEAVAFFSGDGQFRSKIGLGPRRSQAVLGSYDPVGGELTIVQFSQPAGVTDYVNSQWKIQADPYAGDASNSYNDGPPTPGAKALGPFYELESSSAAAALAAGHSLTHTHRTIHLSGSAAALDAIARANLGASLAEITTALPRH